MYGRLTTKDLKKSHSSRCVGRAEMRRRRHAERHREVERCREVRRHGTDGPHPHIVDKIGRDTLGVSDPSPITLSVKTSGGLWQQKKLPDFQVTPLKGTTWS